MAHRFSFPSSAITNKRFFGDGFVGFCKADKEVLCNCSPPTVRQLPSTLWGSASALSICVEDITTLATDVVISSKFVNVFHCVCLPMTPQIAQRAFPLAMALSEEVGEDYTPMPNSRPVKRVKLFKQTPSASSSTSEAPGMASNQESLHQQARERTVENIAPVCERQSQVHTKQSSIQQHVQRHDQLYQQKSELQRQEQLHHQQREFEHGEELMHQQQELQHQLREEHRKRQEQLQEQQAQQPQQGQGKPQQQQLEENQQQNIAQLGKPIHPRVSELKTPSVLEGNPNTNVNVDASGLGVAQCSDAIMIEDHWAQLAVINDSQLIDALCEEISGAMGGGLNKAFCVASGSNSLPQTYQEISDFLSGAENSEGTEKFLANVKKDFSKNLKPVGRISKLSRRMKK